MNCFPASYIGKVLSRNYSAILGVLAAAFAFPSAFGANIELEPGTPIFVTGKLPASVKVAVTHLQRDLKKVFGVPSPLVDDLAKIAGRPAIVIVSPESNDTTWHDPRIKGVEAHGIRLLSAVDGARVVLEGSDARGLIYAIYSFSEECLGVPPLWFWSQWEPQLRTQISIPEGFERVFPPAYVRWRAWFNNDQDFLSPWSKRNPAYVEAMFETILRLKYNTYEVESIANLSPKAAAYAPAKDALAAHERGLAITFHHHSPLGSRIGRDLEYWKAFWVKTGRGDAVPVLSVNNPKALEEFWRYHAETAVRAEFECVWTIAFRGGGDIPFWQTFKDAPADAPARAKVIEEMMRRQVGIVKEVTGESAPPMRTTLYNENSDLFAAGLLRPPDDPALIWTFVAARRDHFPATDVRGFQAPPHLKIGYYLNFQFTSSGSHLAAAEGPWKMAANYRILDALNEQPLAFVVVNAGNIREHVMELSANAAMLWDFKNFEADTFLREFSALYFGDEQAATVANLYRDYYNAYWNQKAPDIPGFDRQYLFQDLRYARAAEMMLSDMRKGIRRDTPLAGHPMDNPDSGSVGYFRVEPRDGEGEIDALLRGSTESGERFTRVATEADRLLPLIDASGRSFFNDNLRLPAHLMAYLNAMLNQVTLAYRSGDTGVAQDHLLAAEAALTGVQKTFNESDHGAFVSWHDGDSKFGVAELKEKITTEVSHLAESKSN